MGLFDEVRFPCECIPEETRKVRLLGLYPQRQEGLVLQRIKIPGGRIRLDQWSGLAIIAKQYTPGFPLHLTTRQDVELHGIHPENVPAIQARLANLGMTCVGAAGDTMRNIVVCPEDGFRRGTWEVSGLAEEIRNYAESLSWIADLPRKFKVSLCGCQQSCTRPWIQDLGLVANADGTFRAIAAGSLGANPRTGLLLFDSLEVGKVLPLVHVLLKLFHDEGDRAHRHCARLRHVRERLGDAAFAQRVEVLLQEEVARCQYPSPQMFRVESGTPLQFRLSLPLGDIMPEDALELAVAAEKAGAELRLGLEHDLYLFGRTVPELSSSMANLIDRFSIVTCPGSTWCTRGIVDSRGAAKRIRQRLSDGSSIPIVVGGCPNNCSQAAVAPLGLLGRVKRAGKRRVEGFRVFVGGGGGRTPVLGRQLHPFVPADDVDKVVGWLLKEYQRLDGNCNTAFLDFLDREFSWLEKNLARRFGIME